jgi:hypothetical protein
MRIYVPEYFGMYQINHQYADITVLTSDTFSIDIDTTSYDSFSAPVDPQYRDRTALCVPIGNVNETSIPVRNVT